MALETIVREKIKHLRSRAGLTQEQLCELAGISVDAVTRVENGSRIPTLATLEKIASALDVSVADLVKAGKVPGPEHSAPVRRIIRVLRGKPGRVQDAAAEIVAALVKACR